MDLSTQKLNDFPFILVTGFLSFIVVTAGAAFSPIVAFPGAHVICMGGTISTNSDVQNPYSGMTVVNHVIYCTQNGVSSNIVLWSVMISFFIYLIGGSLVWWGLRFFKLKTKGPDPKKK